MSLSIRRRSVLLGGAALAAGAPAAQSITLVVWGSTPAENAALDQVIAAFTQATGIVVKKEVIVDKYMDVLKSRFAGRNAPDVFYLDSHEAPMLIESGVLEPVDSRTGGLDDFYPQFLDAFRGRDAKLYGLPKDYSTLALYMNTGLLQRAGFGPQDVPNDLLEVVSFAQRLQAKLPRGVGAMLIEKDLARHLSALETFGLPVITPDGYARFAPNAGVRAYLQALVRGRAARSLYFARQDMGVDAPAAVFGAGKAALMIEGNWVLSALRKDYPEVRYAVREVPTLNGRHHTMAFVVGLSVSTMSRNKAGGFRFAQFMTGPGMALWSQRSGTLPSRRSVQADLRLERDPALAPHIAGAAYATVWSRGTGLPIINNNFGNQVLAALNGSKSVEQALAKVDEASNREIDRQR
jgi:multiple sugar transport system substrate-binding protein